MAFRLLDNKQMIYIYSENSKLGNLGLKIIESINTPIRIININNESLSAIIWAEIGAILGKTIDAFFDISIKITKTYDSFNHYTVADWLQLIEKHPEILKKPIAINGSEVLQIKNKKFIFGFYNGAEKHENFNAQNFNRNNVLSRAI